MGGPALAPPRLQVPETLAPRARLAPQGATAANPRPKRRLGPPNTTATLVMPSHFADAPDAVAAAAAAAAAEKLRR